MEVETTNNEEMLERAEALTTTDVAGAEALYRKIIDGMDVNAMYHWLDACNSKDNEGKKTVELAIVNLTKLLVHNKYGDDGGNVINITGNQMMWRSFLFH